MITVFPVGKRPYFGKILRHLEVKEGETIHRFGIREQGRMNDLRLKCFIRGLNYENNVAGRKIAWKRAEISIRGRILREISRDTRRPADEFNR